LRTPADGQNEAASSSSRLRCFGAIHIVEDNAPVTLPAGSPLVLPATRIDPMAQIAAGVQASYIVPGTDRLVQFFVQAQASATTSGQGQASDNKQGSFGFQGTIPGS